MKREGRQHGMVRTCRILPAPWNPRPESRSGQRLDSPPTAGLFTKVTSKPTNHSKFTGKCGRARCQECHMNPTSKSKDKTKGTQKLRSGDVATNYRLISMRVVDGGPPGLNAYGLSATEMLDDLSTDRDEDYNRCDDDDDNDNGRLGGDGGVTDSWTSSEQQENHVNENDIGSGFALDKDWYFVGEN